MDPFSRVRYSFLPSHQMLIAGGILLLLVVDAVVLVLVVATTAPAAFVIVPPVFRTSSFFSSGGATATTAGPGRKAVAIDRPRRRMPRPRQSIDDSMAVVVVVVSAITSDDDSGDGGGGDDATATDVDYHVCDDRDDLSWRVARVRLEEANTRRFLKAKPIKLPYDVSRLWIQRNYGVRTKREFMDLVDNGGIRTPYISKDPEAYYGMRGEWISWEHYLLGECVPINNGTESASLKWQ
jgi:hypothetical protein